MKIIKAISILFIVIIALPVFSSQTATGSKNLILDFKPSEEKSIQQKNRIQRILKQFDQLKINNDSVVSISTTIRALALTSKAFNYTGKGDVEFWMRTAIDFARTARAMGSSVKAIALRVHNGPVNAALNPVALQLSEIEAGTSGNVDYWMQRTKDIHDQVHNLRDELLSLSNVLGNETMHTHTALRVLVIMMTSSSYEGYGNINYWLRATRNISLLSQSCGQALESLAQQVPEPLYTVLLNYVNQLLESSANGNGDIDYWRDKAKEVSVTLDNIGISVLMVSKKV